MLRRLAAALSTLRTAPPPTLSAGPPTVALAAARALSGAASPAPPPRRVAAAESDDSADCAQQQSGKSAGKLAMLFTCGAAQRLISASFRLILPACARPSVQSTQDLVPRSPLTPPFQAAARRAR